MAAAATNSTPPAINKNMGKITLKIESVDRSECHSTPATEIGGFKWHLEVRRQVTNDHLRPWVLHIFCVSDSDSNTATVEKLWLCKAQFTVRYKPSDDTFLRPMTDQIHFFNGHACHQWAGAVLTIIGRTHSVEMEMEVLVKNFNLSMPLETDLQLLFDGKEELVAVNKFALASFSSYFRNLFFVDWSERAGNDEKNKFSINEENNFDLNAFKLMLYSAMAFGNFVEQGNFLEGAGSSFTLNRQSALAILKLSVKYDVPMLRDYCQEFLMRCYTNIPKMELLNVAEQLGLLHLKDHFLAKITPLDMSSDFGHSNEVYARLSQQTRQRLDKQLSECAKEMADFLDAHESSITDEDEPPVAVGHPLGNDGIYGVYYPIVQHNLQGNGVLQGLQQQHFLRFG